MLESRNQRRYALNILETAQNQILLVLRSPSAHFAPGLWSFPGGGLEKGETAEACSHRELREEIGIHHTLRLLAKSDPLPNVFSAGSGGVFLFHYRWLGGDVRLNEEHTAFAWVGKEEFRTYEVASGIDVDLDYFHIWPRNFLNADRLSH